MSASFDATEPFRSSGLLTAYQLRPLAGCCREAIRALYADCSADRLRVLAACFEAGAPALDADCEAVKEISLGSSAANTPGTEPPKTFRLQRSRTQNEGFLAAPPRPIQKSTDPGRDHTVVAPGRAPQRSKAEDPGIDAQPGSRPRRWSHNRSNDNNVEFPDSDPRGRLQRSLRQQRSRPQSQIENPRSLKYLRKSPTLCSGLRWILWTPLWLSGGE